MAVATKMPVLPTLRISSAPQDGLPTMGLPKLEWPDGTVIDLPTVDDWTLTMSNDGLHILTIRVPVRLDVER